MQLSDYQIKRPRITLTSHLVTQTVDESCEGGKAIKGLAYLTLLCCSKQAREWAESSTHDRPSRLSMRTHSGFHHVTHPFIGTFAT